MTAIDTPAPQKATRKGILGWMFFDWAAQPFFTVVTTFIFGPYFVSRMAPDAATGQAAWGYAIAAGGLVLLQVLLGALNVWLGKHAGLIVGHLTLGTLLWATVVWAGLTLVEVPGPVGETASAKVGAKRATA